MLPACQSRPCPTALQQPPAVLLLGAGPLPGPASVLPVGAGEGAGHAEGINCLWWVCLPCSSSVLVCCPGWRQQGSECLIGKRRWLPSSGTEPSWLQHCRQWPPQRVLQQGPPVLGTSACLGLWGCWRLSCLPAALSMGMDGPAAPVLGCWSWSPAPGVPLTPMVMPWAASAPHGLLHDAGSSSTSPAPRPEGVSLRAGQLRIQGGDPRVRQMCSCRDGTRTFPTGSAAVWGAKLEEKLPQPCPSWPKREKLLRQRSAQQVGTSKPAGRAASLGGGTVALAHALHYSTMQEAVWGHLCCWPQEGWRSSVHQPRVPAVCSRQQKASNQLTHPA